MSHFNGPVFLRGLLDLGRANGVEVRKIAIDEESFDVTVCDMKALESVICVDRAPPKYLAIFFAPKGHDDADK